MLIGMLISGLHVVTPRRTDNTMAIGKKDERTKNQLKTSGQAVLAPPGHGGEHKTFEAVTSKTVWRYQRTDNIIANRKKNKQRSTKHYTPPQRSINTNLLKPGVNPGAPDW